MRMKCILHTFLHLGGLMSNEFTRFLSSLNGGSWLRILLTVLLTTSSVLMAYGMQMGYRLLIGCNLVTVGGAFFLEYKNFKNRSR